MANILERYIREKKSSMMHLSICILFGPIDFMQIDRICKYTLSHDQITQKFFMHSRHSNLFKKAIKWCEQELGVKVDQVTISRTLKCSSEYISWNERRPLDSA